MKRRVQLDDNPPPEKVRRNKEALLLPTKFDASHFHFSINREDSDIISCLTKWLNAYEAYEVGKSTVDPVAEFFVHSYDGEELVKWLDRVEEPFAVHSVLSVVFKIISHASESASSYKQRSILVFGQVVRRAAKLHRQLCQAPVMYRSMVLKTLASGAGLGAVAVDDLVRFFDLDDAALAQQFKDPALLSSCVNFLSVLVRCAGYHALQRICGEKFILQTMLRNVKSSMDSHLIYDAVQVIRLIIESKEVSRSSRVRILHGCLRSVCSLIGKRVLDKCLEDFFCSCIESLHALEVNFDECERDVNNALYKVYAELAPRVCSSPLTTRVILKLVQLCPDLLSHCLEHDCEKLTQQTQQQIGFLWATLLKETNCQVTALSSKFSDAKAFATFAVPEVAVKRLAAPLWKSKNADSVITASKILRALVLRANGALDTLEGDGRLQEVASIFVESLPTFKEVHLCFLHARRLHESGGPYELAVSTAELVASILLLLRRISTDFLLNIDLVQVFLSTESFLNMGLKLQLLFLLPQSSLELIDLVRKSKEGRSIVGSLLRCYEEAADSEVLSLDDAFCQMCQLSEVLANHTIEVKLWLAAFAHASSGSVKECFEDIVHSAVCTQYSRYEETFRSVEMMHVSWPLEGDCDTASMRDCFDQFASAVKGNLEFSILVSTLLWWCKKQEPLTAEVKQCVSRCLRLLLWFQKGDRDRLLTLLKNSDSSLAKAVAKEEDRLERKAKLRTDADPFEAEAFSRYMSSNEPLRDGVDLVGFQSCPAARLDNFLFLIHLWRKARTKNLSSEEHMLSLVDQAMYKWKMDAELFLQIDVVKANILGVLLRLRLSAEVCFSSPSFSQLMHGDLPRYMSELTVASRNLPKSVECAARLASMATAEQLMATLSGIEGSGKLNFKVYEFFWLRLLDLAKKDQGVAVQLRGDRCTCVVMRLFRGLPEKRSSCDSVFRIMISLVTCLPVELDYAGSAELLLPWIVKSGEAVKLFLVMQKADQNAEMRSLFFQWVLENPGSLPDAADALLPIFAANIAHCNKDLMSTLSELYAGHFANVALWNNDLISLALAQSKSRPHIMSVLLSAFREVASGPNCLQFSTFLTVMATALDDCLSAMELLVFCIDQKERASDFEITLVDRVKLLWRPPIGSALYRELWQLIFSRRFASVSHMELVCQMVSRVKSTTNLSMVSMIFGHSLFGPVVVLGKDEPLKFAMLSLLLACCENDRSAVNPSHVPALLSSYGATLGLADTTILKLLVLYENSGVDLSIFYPLVWGPMALSSFANWKQLGPSLWNRPSANEVLSCIDEERMKNTVVNFPVELSLDVRDSCPASDMYDPRFLLPAFGVILRCESVVNCRRFVTTHCLSFLLCGLSFADPGLRAQCYSNLVDFHEALKGSENFAEKSQLSFLLALVRQSVKRDNQRLPFVVSLFLARVVEVFINPKDPVYRTVCQFLLIRPRMSFGLIPNFLRFFHSSGAQHRQERLWVLNLLADGLRTTVDFKAACKLFAFKFLFSFYNCYLCESSQRSAILRVMLAVSRIPKAATVLCKQSNWFGFLLTLCEGPSAWIVVEVLCEIFRLIFRRKRPLRWNLAVGWISCACCALSKATTRSSHDMELAIRLVSMVLKAYATHPFGSTVSQLSDIVDKWSPYMDDANVCTTRRLLGRAFIQSFCVSGAATISNDLLRHYLSTVYVAHAPDELLVNTVRKIGELCGSESRFEELKPYFLTGIHPTSMRQSSKTYSPSRGA